MSEQAAQSLQEALRASYTYSFADFQAARRARRKLNPIEHTLWPWRYAVLLGINLALFVYIIWDYGFTADEVLSWAYLSEIIPLYLGLLVAMALIDIIFDKVIPSWVFKRYSMANMPLAMTFDDDRINWSSEGLRGDVAWSKVTTIVTLKGYVFLFISKLEALCIPQRAFASNDAFNHFIDYAKERVNG